MKKRVFNFSLLTSVSLVAFSALGLSACATSNSVPAVRLNVSQLTMKVGETKEIKLSVAKSAMNLPVRWFTSNDNVVYFRDTSSGFATAIGEGTAKVTASIGGAFVDCQVTVEPDESDPNAPRLTVTPTSVELVPGDTKQLTVSVNPADTTWTATSDHTEVATVDATGLISAVADGTAKITIAGSNNITKYVSVKVASSGGGGGEENDYAIDVSHPYTYGGTMYIGAAQKNTDITNYLLNAFNSVTRSNIKFQITPMEEKDGVSKFAGPTAVPDVFPYASDQIIEFYNFGCLQSLGSEQSTWIKRAMGQDAYDAVRMNKKTWGFPFSADNGVVMFYDKGAVSDPSEIDTVDKLVAKAKALSKSVRYQAATGYYAAGLLHTFTQGESLYTATHSGTSYTVSTKFATSQAAYDALVYAHDKIFSTTTIRNGDQYPGGNVLATIIDTSNAQDIKSTLGNNYGVAPLPWVDDAHTARLGSYLGYKFFGVNSTLANDKKDLAFTIAQFLASPFAQKARFDQMKTQATILALQDYCKSEPHIAALIQQKSDKATILQLACGSELWSATAKALTTINSESFVPSESNYWSVLADLDDGCHPK